MDNSIRESIRAGSVIYATELLDNTYFENSLILLLDKNSDGLFGVIINRPTHMPLSEVFTPVPDSDVKSRTFYAGGPIDDDNLIILDLISLGESRSGKEVGPGVEMGGQWDNLTDIIESNPETTLLFLGYSGWSTNQLIEEIKEGSWQLYKGLSTTEILNDWREPVTNNRDEIEEWLSLNGERII